MKQVVAILIGVGFIAGTFAFAEERETHEFSEIKSDDSTTRTLILLRHAKSDKSNMNMPDIERPLEASGREEAEEMGDVLAKKIDHIDYIISSPSVRTKQTLEIICKKIGYPYESVEWDSSLYACSGEHLQKRIKETNVENRTVMYVGHNPSITSAANALQSNENIEEVKTCGVVTIDFTTGFWSNVSKENGTLRFYAKPK